MKNKTMCIQCGKNEVAFDLRDISGMEPEEGFCSIECVDDFEMEEERERQIWNAELRSEV